MSSYAELKDFDWSARLVLSSDKLSTLRLPILLLKLDVTMPDGTIGSKTVELTVSDLKSLLASLKSAQQVMDK